MKLKFRSAFLKHLVFLNSILPTDRHPHSTNGIPKKPMRLFMYLSNTLVYIKVLHLCPLLSINLSYSIFNSLAKTHWIDLRNCFLNSKFKRNLNSLKIP